VLDEYGYLKYYDSFSEEGEEVLWTNWDYFNGQVRMIIPIDAYPDNDFLSFYRSEMNSNISSYRSCIATHTGEYGYYGYGSNKEPITIEGKTWRYAWQEGFLEGLLVYPIAWCIDGLVDSFASLGMDIAKGGPQVLAIVIMTLAIRLIFTLATLKPTLNNQKMNQLQPEIQKIQAKYPNSKENRRDQELMAMEQQKLYKKYHIRPWVSIVVMVVQFPIFICVWGAMSGSAYLSSGEFLGVRLSDTMYSVIFSGASWSSIGAGGFTALMIFLLMAAIQITSMLLPQLLHRKERKKVAKLNKNPSGDRQRNTGRIMQWVMVIMIVIMGFMLAAAMCIYWLVGPIVNIAQTLILDRISRNQIRKQKYEKYRTTTSSKNKKNVKVKNK
ncbi:MAG: membrane protein insertase YidC, partial [Coprobacillus sp.]|nr:membrane protein insertase YidC [Coprobacillus sp.]